MTRSPDQRLDTVEDELETVKRLLVSAASYAESANQGLERLTERQDRTQAQLDRLTVTVENISQKVDDLTVAQAQSQSRMDEFVFQAQRLFTQSAERLIRLEGQTERLEALLQRLDRNHSAQQSQLQEFQQTTGAALERIDRILDYLLRQQGGEE